MLRCVISCREAVDVDQHQTAQEMRIERDARPTWRQESNAASRRERNSKGPETMLDCLRASTGNGSEAPRRARTPSVCGESPAETATQRFITPVHSNAWSPGANIERHTLPPAPNTPREGAPRGNPTDFLSL